MNTVLAVLVLTLIVGARLWTTLWFKRGHQSPEGIHHNVLVPYMEALSAPFRAELVENAGVEFPILVSSEHRPNLCMSAVSLVLNTFIVNERTRKVYCTSIRLGICIKNPDHRSTILYRHPSSSCFSRRGPFVFTNKKGWNALTPAQQRALQQFIAVHNCVRYRPVEGANDMLLPPQFKADVQQLGLDMVLSTEFFSPRANPQLFSEKVAALQALAAELERQTQRT